MDGWSILCFKGIDKSKAAKLEGVGNDTIKDITEIDIERIKHVQVESKFGSKSLQSYQPARSKECCQRDFTLPKDT